MLRNQIKLALRNFIKFKSYAIINLIGMGLALSIGILILVYILDEISFDKFHTKGDRVYKVVTTNPDGGGMETNAWPVARKLQDEFPEVEAAVYCRRAPASMMVNYEGNRYQHNIHYADNNFFNLFSFQFIEGDPGSALQSPYSIVIT